jgi:predicted transcriptional regulator
MDETIESTSLTERVVLLGVTELAARGEASIHSSTVKRTCVDRLEDVDGDVVGSLSEADVVRALNGLEGEGLVERVSVENPSPVGKGRPTYDLPESAESVLDALEADDRVARLVERVRERT